MSTPTVADLVAVKPLEWKDLSDNSGALLVAEAGFGGLEYSLMDYAGGEWNWGTNFVGPSGYLGVQGKCPTLDAAKVAAQADYERRILAALSPAATEPVAWMQRHKLGPHHLCNHDTQGNDDWSDPFPVYAHSSPVTAEAAAREAALKIMQMEVETFCRRVEAGEIRSKRTYAAFKDCLRALAGEKS